MLPAILLAIVVGIDLLGSLDGLLAFGLTPSGALTILVLLLLSGAWRIIAVVDAVATARRGGSQLRRPAIVVVGALLALTLAMHGSAAYLAYTVYDAGTRIFVGNPDDPGQTPGGSQDPTGSGLPGASPTDDFQATPDVTPSSPTARINILLTGVDSAENRTTSLTDTLLVVSVNPADGSVVMLSLPRDISNFPLYDGRTFTGKINSLMTWARNHPSEFPDGPFPTLIKEVGYLVGVPIHYYAAIDLQGFRRVIDTVGGVTVVNEKPINDPRYAWLDGTHGFYLDAGTVKLDGRTALAYARSRQGVGDSDFTRAARQQQLLLALRAKLTSPDMITKLPDIIKVAGDTIRTNFDTGRLEEMIAIARGVDSKSVQQFVLGPGYATHPPNNTTGGIYTLKLDLVRVAKLSIRLFGSDSRYASQ
jgi:LCP family protein required for cell wall assembly